MKTMMNNLVIGMMLGLFAVAIQAGCITTGQGNSSYTTCSDGSSAYTQHQGNSSYSFYGDGTTGYTQRQGNGTTYQSFSGPRSGYAAQPAPPVQPLSPMDGYGGGYNDPGGGLGW